MDGATFDTLTKRLAGTNQRNLLTGLTGGILAVVGLGVTTCGAASCNAPPAPVCSDANTVALPPVHGTCATSSQ